MPNCWNALRFFSFLFFFFPLSHAHACISHVLPSSHHASPLHLSANVFPSRVYAFLFPRTYFVVCLRISLDPSLSCNDTRLHARTRFVACLFLFFSPYFPPPFSSRSFLFLRLSHSETTPGDCVHARFSRVAFREGGETTRRERVVLRVGLEARQRWLYWKLVYWMETGDTRRFSAYKGTTHSADCKLWRPRRAWVSLIYTCSQRNIVFFSPFLQSSFTF